MRPLFFVLFFTFSLHATERLNVVMVEADDLNPTALGYMGHRVVKTPHLDRLASQGTVFKNCIVQGTAFAPSRNSLLTGTYPHNTGIYMNASSAGLPENCWAFPDPERGGPKIMIETKTGEKQLPIVPPKTNWGRFSWLSNPSPKSQHPTPWTFVSIPDFLNFDIEYPQKGWEDALGFIVDSMKKENPAFAMVAGDLVMGHWGTSKKEIDQWADKYYPAWTRRFQDHGLKVYTALGDHEVADNPWRGDKAAAVPFYKAAFRRHLGMPLNGPDHMKGTAFYWLHKNALFVSVDVFEKGKSNQGEIAAGVTGRQLEWFEKVVSEHRPKVDHIVVMGHTPILRPVRTYSSSGMLTLKGRDSDFWKVMAKHGVDLYLCGEVHAVTCIRRDGIQQVAHGGLIGRTTKPNYMVVTVHKDRLNLDIKEIDLINGKGRLWQKNKSRGPWDTITITAARKEQGFTSIGKVVINKLTNTRKFEAATGFFIEKNNPKANSRSKN